jgi:hypothetical protein
VLDEHRILSRRSDEVGPVQTIAVGPVQTIVLNLLLAKRERVVPTVNRIPTSPVDTGRRPLLAVV